MTRAERAKIFMPFSALNGYYDLILAQEEGHEVRREIYEEKAAAISEKLNKIDKGSSIEVEYYNNGCYLTEKGAVSCIERNFKYLIISEQKIWFDDILRIEDYVPEGRETWFG